MPRKWIVPLSTAIIVFFSSFILFVKVLPPSDFQKEIVRLEMEVASLRREIDSRFNVMKWDLETVVNRRSYTLDESISALRYRKEELKRDVLILKKEVEELKKSVEEGAPRYSLISKN